MNFNPFDWGERWWLGIALAAAVLLAGRLIRQHAQRVRATREYLADLSVRDVVTTGRMVQPEDEDYLPSRWLAQDEGLTSPRAPMTEPVPKMAYAGYDYFRRDDVIADREQPTAIRRPARPLEVHHLPRDIAARAQRVVAEAEGWHWSFGKWEAPVSLWQHLPQDDWLRQLVTA